jgi:hypothetical protein
MRNNYTVIERAPGLPPVTSPVQFDSYSEALNYLVKRNNELAKVIGGEPDAPEGVGTLYYRYLVTPIVNGTFSYWDNTKPDDGYSVKIIPTLELDEQDRD